MGRLAGLAGMRPAATGIELRFELFRPTVSTEKVELRLLDTATKLPLSSSSLESSPPRPPPYIELDRRMLVSVRVDHPPLLPW
jgi:hypothetical protein